MNLIEHFNCRSLRCTRIRIHVQLFTSLALSCILWIIWYKFVIVNPDVTTQSPMWCIGLHIATQYLMISSYFWMFCEGMHLHLVLVVVFIKDNVAMRIFTLIGWGFPVIIVAIYSFFRSKDAVDSTLWVIMELMIMWWKKKIIICAFYSCWMEESFYVWIFIVPVLISFIFSISESLSIIWSGKFPSFHFLFQGIPHLINWYIFPSFIVFLINIVRVLIMKLHPKSAAPAPLAIKKAVRATLILIPLFGLQHILFPFRPGKDSALEGIYQILSAVVISLQGLCVSCLFCFANHEVIMAILSYLSSLSPTLFKTPYRENYQQGPTTTRELVMWMNV